MKITKLQSGILIHPNVKETEELNDHDFFVDVIEIVWSKREKIIAKHGEKFYNLLIEMIDECKKI